MSGQLASRDIRIRLLDGSDNHNQPSELVNAYVVGGVIPGQGTSQQYVDGQDAETLDSAKKYTDSKTSEIDSQIKELEKTVDGISIPLVPTYTYGSNSTTNALNFQGSNSETTNIRLNQFNVLTGKSIGYDTVKVPLVSDQYPGFMSPSYKKKIDEIDLDNITDEIDSVKELIETETSERKSADEELDKRVDWIENYRKADQEVNTKEALNNLNKSLLNAGTLVEVKSDEDQGGISYFYQLSEDKSEWLGIGPKMPYALEGESSSITLLDEYSETPSNDSAYNSSYINSRLDNINVVLGKEASTPSFYKYNVVIGNKSTAENGNTSVAIGYESKVQSAGAVSIGANSTASNGYSVSLGQYSQSGRNNEVSIGGYDGSIAVIPKTRYLANVTAGEKDTDAVNLKQMKDYVSENSGSSILYDEYGINEDGSLTQKFVSDILNSDSVIIGEGAKNTLSNQSAFNHDFIVIGHNASVNNTGTISIGRDATVTGQNAIAIGNSSVAWTGEDTAFGDRAVAKGGSNTAFGPLSSSTGDRSDAIGGNTVARHDSSVALGWHSETSRDNELSIGYILPASESETEPRRYTKYIAYVKAGELDDDAVNVKQMKDYVTSEIGNINSILDEINGETPEEDTNE